MPQQARVLWAVGGFGGHSGRCTGGEAYFNQRAGYTCVEKETCLVKGRMSCRSEKSSSVALRRALMVVCFCMQVEFMGEQQRKLQGELEQREQQVQELQRARNEMYEKLMEAENSKGRHDEARLHKELAQLQVGAGREGQGQRPARQ